MQKLLAGLSFVLVLFLGSAGISAQGMPGTQRRQPCAPSAMPMQQQPLQGMQPKTEQPMPSMEMGKVPDPDLLITSFEKQVVLPDEALPFQPTGMGEKFFAKLIAKVDFGNGVWFSVRKARLPNGGNVGIMSMTEICYIEQGLGLLMDAKGEEVKTVPAGAWFTVPTNWRHTIKSIGEDDLIMTVIRVGPKSLH